MKIDVYEPFADFSSREDSWAWLEDHYDDE